jgi:aminoglycoside phosphotransferase (APT) family kinase protein
MLPSPSDPTYEPQFVSTLLDALCPELAPARVRQLAHGWDCDVFVVNEQFVARLSRNLLASAALLREARLLPLIAPQLPLPIPVPFHVGDLAQQPGLRFALYGWLPGVALCEAVEARPRAGERRSHVRSDYSEPAKQLGQFLRALHALELSELPKLPGDELGRLDAARRSGPARERIAQLVWEGALTRPEQRQLERRLDAAEASALGPTRTLVHGDLHDCNLLVHEGMLSGVIDWVDAHVGHPAVDLAAAFVGLPPHAAGSLLSAYGEVAPSTLAWARWRAITQLTMAVSGALARSDMAMASACVERLRLNASG